MVKKIEIKDLYYKPKFEFFNEVFFGKTFTGIKQSPNIYIIKSDDIIEVKETISFDWQGVNYTLTDVYEHFNEVNNWRIIECRTWGESDIDSNRNLIGKDWLQV